MKLLKKSSGEETDGANDQKFKHFVEVMEYLICSDGNDEASK